MREGQTLFTYLHLARPTECTEALVARKVTGDRLRDRRAAGPVAAAARPDVRGRRPDGPAGRRARLKRADGGRGVLMGGVSGVYAAKVVVIGAGRLRHERRGDRPRHAGRGAPARPQHRRGCARPTPSTRATCRRSRRTPTRSSGPCSTPTWSSARCSCPGAKAPTLVTNELVSRMKPGSVLVDIAIDQGGCFEDSQPTTHADPTYQVHDSVFYCVANMPGAVPHTSTYALTNVTLPYAVELANRGWREALPGRPRAGPRPQHPRRRRRPTGPVAEAHGLTPRSSRTSSADRAGSVGRATAGAVPGERGGRLRRYVKPEPARATPLERAAARVPRPPGRRARARGQHAGCPTAATCAATPSSWPARGVDRARAWSPRPTWPRSSRRCARATPTTRRWPPARPPAPWWPCAASTGSPARGAHRERPGARGDARRRPPRRLPKAIPVSDVEALLEAAGLRPDAPRRCATAPCSRSSTAPAPGSPRRSGSTSTTSTSSAGSSCCRARAARSGSCPSGPTRCAAVDGLPRAGPAAAGRRRAAGRPRCSSTPRRAAVAGRARGRCCGRRPSGPG